MSAEDEKLLKEAKKLPWEDRLGHKNWKVRNEANVDLASVCDSITDPKDSRLRDFGHLFRKTVADSNAPVQEKALGKRLSSIHFETVKSNRLALRELLFTKDAPRRVSVLTISRPPLLSVSLSGLSNVVLNMFEKFMARCEEYRKNTLAGFLVMHKELYMNQSQPIRTVVNSSVGCLVGAVFGYTLGTLLPQSTTHSQTLVGGPWVQAQAFAGVASVNCAVSGLIEGIRGKESLLSAMVAAAASGVAYSFLSRDWQGRPINLLYSAIGFTVFQGLLFCLSDVIIPDPKYKQTRSMLHKLELQKYEKTFKKANLTDSTLMLLTDGLLKEASIPPGARLLILQHIQSSKDPLYRQMKTMLVSLGLEKYEKQFKDGHLTDFAMPFLTDELLKEAGIPPVARLMILDFMKRDSEIKRANEGSSFSI